MKREGGSPLQSRGPEPGSESTFQKKCTLTLVSRSCNYAIDFDIDMRPSGFRD